MSRLDQTLWNHTPLKRAQKQSLPGTKIRQRKIDDFSWFFNIMIPKRLILTSRHIAPKKANLDFQTYCNTFWMISGTSKTSTKSGPSDPEFLTKIFQRHKKIWEHPWNILFVYRWDSEVLKRLEGLCTYILIFKFWFPKVLFCEIWSYRILFSETLKSWNFEIWTLMHWAFGNFEIWKVENWNNEIWKI